MDGLPGVKSTFVRNVVGHTWPSDGRYILAKCKAPGDASNKKAYAGGKANKEKQPTDISIVMELFEVTDHQVQEEIAFHQGF